MKKDNKNFLEGFLTAIITTELINDKDEYKNENIVTAEIYDNTNSNTYHYYNNINMFNCLKSCNEILNINDNAVKILNKNLKIININAKIKKYNIFLSKKFIKKYKDDCKNGYYITKCNFNTNSDYIHINSDNKIYTTDKLKQEEFCNSKNFSNEFNDITEQSNYTYENIKANEEVVCDESFTHTINDSNYIENSSNNLNENLEINKVNFNEIIYDDENYVDSESNVINDQESVKNENILQNDNYLESEKLNDENRSNKVKTSEKYITNKKIKKNCKKRKNGSILVAGVESNNFNLQSGEGVKFSNIIKLNKAFALYNNTSHELILNGNGFYLISIKGLIDTQNSNKDNFIKIHINNKCDNYFFSNIRPNQNNELVFLDFVYFKEKTVKLTLVSYSKNTIYFKLLQFYAIKISL